MSQILPSDSSVECAQALANEHDQVVCLVCNEYTGQAITQHLLRDHDLTPTEYRDHYPDAPIVAKSVREKQSEAMSEPRIDVGMYEWDRLDVRRRLLLRHREWLMGLEHLLEEKTAPRVIDVANQLDLNRFRPRVATAIYHVLRQEYPFITAGEIADETGVPEKTLLRRVKAIDNRPNDLRNPEQFIRDRDEFYDYYDELRDRIADYPDSFVYGGTQPNMVAAVAVWEVCDFTKDEVAAMFDVTTNGLTKAQRRKDFRT